MFDRNLIYSRTEKEYVPFEKTIIEKRAPTDDSIRLYGEIKEKSYNSIIDTIKINDNIFNVKAIIYNDPLEFCRKCKFIFSINGNDICGIIDLPFDVDYNRENCIKLLYYKCSEKLAEEMLKLVYREL